MEAASGMDLEQFFAQWVFQGGIPHLEGSWQQDEDGVEVNFSQVQETYEFELTVDVEVVFEDGSSAIATIEMPIGGSAQVLVPTESKATEVRIDPKTRLLATWSLEQK